MNVWLALLLEDHMHRASARAWWEADGPEAIAFVRLTQVSVLRLLTTSAAMSGKPLTMPEAWKAYDRLFEDDRVTFLDEPQGVDLEFRNRTRSLRASPKLWADAWLIAFADSSGGTVVTFDRGLAAHARDCQLLD